MAKIDITLSGVAITDTKDIGTNLARFELLVLGAVLHSCGNARKTFPQPVRISMDIIGPAKTKQSLPTIGAEVEVHIVGEPDNFITELVSVIRQPRLSLKSLIQSL